MKDEFLNYFFYIEASSCNCGDLLILQRGDKFCHSHCFYEQKFATCISFNCISRLLVLGLPFNDVTDVAFCCHAADWIQRNMSRIMTLPGLQLQDFVQARGLAISSDLMDMSLCPWTCHFVHEKIDVCIR